VSAVSDVGMAISHYNSAVRSEAAGEDRPALIRLTMAAGALGHTPGTVMAETEKSLDPLFKMLHDEIRSEVRNLGGPSRFMVIAERKVPNLRHVVMYNLDGEPCLWVGTPDEWAPVVKINKIKKGDILEHFVFRGIFIEGGGLKW